MTAIRLTPDDWALVHEALERYIAECENHVCLDYVESHGLDAARTWERKAEQTKKLLSRIVLAKEIHNA